uniref:Uncharacterized protein n=1 Tax=Trichuris muris TaxID=70415 RepID=A0A5S6QEP1_TRIMR
MVNRQNAIRSLQSTDDKREKAVMRRTPSTKQFPVNRHPVFKIIRCAHGAHCLEAAKQLEQCSIEMT